MAAAALASRTLLLLATCLAVSLLVAGLPLAAADMEGECQIAAHDRAITLCACGKEDVMARITV